MQRFIFTILLSGLLYWGHAQINKTDSLQISKYLYNQLDYEQIRLSCQMLDSISSAELYCTKMNFNMGDGGSLPTSYHLIKTKSGFKPVYSSDELITCPEFLASIDKNFRLEDEKSGFKLQELLDLVDSRNNMNSDRAFFKKNNTWYFIRDEFFDDYELFVIEISDKGEIIAITFKKEKNIEIPENVVKSSGHRAEWGYEIPAVSQEDSLYLRSYLDEQTNFHFEFKKLESRLVNNITSAEFYHAKIVFTNGGSSFSNGFSLMKTNDTIMHSNSNRELLEKPAFMKSLKTSLVIKSKEDAMTFEEALDVLVPIGTFDAEAKELLKVENKWYFVRSESFGDKAAFVAETDAKGHIKSFTYNYKAIKGD